MGVSEQVYAGRRWPRIVPTTPLDPASLATIRATAGGVDRALRVEFENMDHVLVSPVTAFPPDLQVTLDLTGVRDVLGRTPGSAVSFDAPPSAEVADLTFAAPLPAGSAVVGLGASTVMVASGLLEVRLDYWSGATIALGARTGSTAGADIGAAQEGLGGQPADGDRAGLLEAHARP